MPPELELEDELLEDEFEELLELVDEEELLLEEAELLDEEELPSCGAPLPPHPTNANAAVIKAGTKGRNDKLRFFMA